VCRSSPNLEHPVDPASHFDAGHGDVPQISTPAAARERRGADDVILEVDRRPVTGPQALAVQSGKSDPVPLLVRRENRTFFSVITP
jgi:hypothetical protein